MSIDYPVQSFPCIKCGSTLTRVSHDTEGQPNDGIMCISYGNYGSTVFDPDDLSYLAFNLCDDCVVKLGNQGRIMVTRSRAPVSVHGMGIVGWIRCERPYVSWRRGLADDGAGITLDIEELDDYADEKRIHWAIPIEEIKKYLTS